MIKLIKKIISAIKYFFETFWMGLYYVCLIISKGFFFYFYSLFSLIGKVFRFSFIEKIKNYFKKLQQNPVSSLSVILVCLFGAFFYVYLYSANNVMIHVPDDLSELGYVAKPAEQPTEVADSTEEDGYTDDNLYRRYGATSLNEINFSNLKATNPDVVAWLIVDSTNINYPIVQSGDNEYYLYHDINGVSKISGWTFMDYRNSYSMTDQNTIFYGHNLLNRTAFGSVANIFTDDWFDNSTHRIIVLTENGSYVYEVFSNYYIDPEVYYLQTNFSSKSSYQTFLDTLKSRSIYDYGVEVTSDDKIITLSTCTDDNTGRKVVHAKLMKD
ncbi:MAG: class B sortase [Bacilli bacterium]|nr:class B sortase [Bacilli bacterium]